MNDLEHRAAPHTPAHPALSHTGCVRRLLPCALALAAAATSARADMLISGEFRYVDRAFTYDQGWTGEEPELPVRLAHVLVLDASTEDVLAEGSTDLEGHFAIAVPGRGSVDLLVRCLSTSDVLAPEAITVGQTDGTLYSVSTQVFAGHDLSTDLDTGLTVAQKVFSGLMQGNPFNLLDMAVEAFRYVDALGLPPTTEPFEIHWPNGPDSSSNGVSLVKIATKAAYSDTLVLHEIGHTMDARYSEPDSPGDVHSFGDSDQDPSLSLSEGFASWFSGATRSFAGVDDPGFYFSGSGTAVTGPASILLRLDYETRKPFAGTTGGEADEAAVCAALWDVSDTAATADGDEIDDDLADGGFAFGGRYAGDALVFAGMTAPTVLEAQSVNVIDLWDAFFVDVHTDHFDALADAFERNRIAVLPDAFEPDDAPSQAVGVVPGSGWSETRSLVASREWPPVPGAGDRDSIAFTLPANTLFEVETRYPDGKSDAQTYADTFLIVRDPHGVQIGGSDVGGQGRNAKVTQATAEAGTYTATIRTLSPSRRTGRYEVRVVDLGPVQAPVVTSLAPQSLPSVPDGYLQGLTLHGEHFIGTQSVTVGGVPANFSAFADDTLAVSLPVVAQLGAQDVVVRNAVGETSVQVTVLEPQPPALNVNAGSLYWSHDPIGVLVGAGPDDVVHLFVAFENGPTVIPGVLDLDIGAAGSSLFLIASVPLGPSGVQKLELRQPAALEGSVSLFMQGAVQKAGGGLGPLVSTNVEPGIVLP
ncbi:MAG: hypothetical protein H6825_06715 [Planctomycetes bacterium]|nr:hypothetical protein [Planctomycetota bacterium]